MSVVVHTNFIQILLIANVFCFEMYRFLVNTIFYLIVYIEILK